MTQQASASALFDRIREKCQQQGWFGPELLSPSWSDVADRDLGRQGFVFPPATAEQIAETHQRLGFSLPANLTALYTHIANGGFGPGAGLRGVVGGYRFHEQNAVEAYHHRKGAQVVNREGQSVCWPRLLLPICDLGDVNEACLDGQTGQIIVVAPTEHEGGVVPLMTLEAPSLEDWLERWLQGEPLKPIR